MTLDNSEGSLKIQLGKRGRRIASVTAKRATRRLIFSDCTVTAARIGRNIPKEPFEVCADEWEPGEELWPEDPEKIGALDTERMFLSVVLPPEAFGQLWAIREEGSVRTIQIRVRNEPSESTLSVTEVTLVEYLP